MTSRSAPITLSVMGRLLRARKVAWAVLLTVAGLVFGLLAVAQALRMREVVLPDIALAADGLVVASSDRPEVAPGDRLVAIDGLRAYDHRLASMLDEITAGPALALTFARAGDEVTLSVATGPLDDLHAVALWVRVVCGLMSFVVGVVSFVLAPGSRAAWLFLLFCVNIELTLLFNVVFVRDADLFTRLEPITFALGASLGLHLFTELPRRLPLVERRPWVAALFYLPAAIVVIPSLFLPPPPASSAWGWLALGGAAWSLLGGLVTTGFLVSWLRRARRDDDAPLASATKTLLVALLIGLFLPAVIHTARGLTGAGGERWIVHLNAAPVLAYAAATAYALLRQNVMGADRVTTIVVSYAATVILLGVVCGVALVAVPLLVEGRVASSPVVLVLTTAAASLSIVPIYRRLRRAVDRQFLRDRVSDERITAELRELMRLAMLGDPAETQAGAFKALQAVQPERIELWVREAEGDAFHRRRGEHSLDADPAPVAASGALGKAMLAEQSGGVEGLAATALHPDAQTELWQRGLAIAAPVPVQGEVRAFLALGRRSSGARYRTGEQSFLAMVAQQVGLALERGEAGTSIGRYRLDRRLGTGGMAEVYLARQLGMAGFERRVAIKRPLPHLAEDSAFISMLIDEAKLAAQLHHPAIVQTYEVDRQGGTTYIAMEYVDGASLRTILRSARTAGETPPLAVTARILDTLLGALAYAHTATDARGRTLGIVHRDVTPGNVLVSSAGEVKLVDFGVARSVTRLQVTQTGMLKGTLAYMAPEQAHGGDVDARSDLFGAGAVLYQCLMDEPPYPDGPPREPPPGPPPLRADLPPALVAVVQRALAYRPEDRFSSADEMRAAFLPACGVAPARPSELADWQRQLLGRAPTPDDPSFQEAETAVDNIR